jgi:hypothetical protein
MLGDGELEMNSAGWIDLSSVSLEADALVASRHIATALEAP